jgi:hypothetical protein
VDDAAEDHGAEPAVAHRQRPHPLGGAGLPQRVERQQRMIGCRRAIPEAERRRRRRGFADQPRRCRGLCSRDRDDETGGK